MDVIKKTTSVSFMVSGTGQQITLERVDYPFGKFPTKLLLN